MQRTALNTHNATIGLLTNTGAIRMHLDCMYFTTISKLAVSTVMVRVFARREEPNTIWSVRDAAGILTWSETRHRLAAP